MSVATSSYRPSKSFSWADDEEDNFDFDTWKAEADASLCAMPLSASSELSPDDINTSDIKSHSTTSFSWADDEDDNFDFDTWKVTTDDSAPALSKLGPLQLSLTEEVSDTVVLNTEKVTTVEDKPSEPELTTPSSLPIQDPAVIAEEVQWAQKNAAAYRLYRNTEAPAWPLMSFYSDGFINPTERISYTHNWNHYKAANGFDCRVPLMLCSSSLREVTNIDELEVEVEPSFNGTESNEEVSEIAIEDLPNLSSTDSVETSSLGSWETSDDEEEIMHSVIKLPSLPDFAEDTISDDHIYEADVELPTPVKIYLDEHIAHQVVKLPSLADFAEGMDNPMYDQDYDLSNNVPIYWGEGVDDEDTNTSYLAKFAEEAENLMYDGDFDLSNTIHIYCDEDIEYPDTTPSSLSAFAEGSDNLNYDADYDLSNIDDESDDYDEGYQSVTTTESPTSEEIIIKAELPIMIDARPTVLRNHIEQEDWAEYALDIKTMFNNHDFNHNHTDSNGYPVIASQQTMANDDQHEEQDAQLSNASLPLLVTTLTTYENNTSSTLPPQKVGGSQQYQLESSASHAGVEIGSINDGPLEATNLLPTPGYATPSCRKIASFSSKVGIAALQSTFKNLAYCTVTAGLHYTPAVPGIAITTLLACATLQSAQAYFKRR